MEDERAILAGLLRQLESPATPPAVRLQAAIMANRLALSHADPSLTDVAESLAVVTDPSTPPEILRGLTSESDIASATRGTITRAHRQRLKNPKDLTLSLVADPVLLAQRVREQLARGDSHLTPDTPEAGRYRHPQALELKRLDPAVEDPDDKLQPAG